MEETKTKTCTQCGEAYPATTLFFSRRPNVGDGFVPHCKVCRSNAQKNRVSRKVLESNLTGKDYKVKAKTKRYVYHDPVETSLRENPERSNRWIASETGAPYEFVSTMRMRLEESGEIPFVTETINEKGDWRRRLIRHDRISDPWGSQHVVYFIRYKDMAESPIKIGRTNCMKKRLKAYHLHNGLPIEVMLVIMADSQFEADAIELFKEDNLHGEWFKHSERLLAFIESLRPQEAKHPISEDLQKHVVASPYHDPSYHKSRRTKISMKGGPRRYTKSVAWYESRGLQPPVNNKPLSSTPCAAEKFEGT